MDPSDSFASGLVAGILVMLAGLAGEPRLRSAVLAPLMAGALIGPLGLGGSWSSTW